MEAIAAFSVRRPVLISMAVLVVLVMGGASLWRMGLDLLPDIEFPALAVVTPYPGAGPVAVEQQVTRLVEGALAITSNVTRTTSLSMENLSLVVAQVNWGSNLNVVLNEINENLQRIRLSLPKDAQVPVVLRLDPTKLPIMLLGVTAAEGSQAVREPGGRQPASGAGDKAPAGDEDRFTEELAWLTARVRDRLVPALERVGGVGRVAVTGGTTERVEVRYDPRRLQEVGISPGQLAQLLTFQNVDIPLGPLTEEGRRYQLRAGAPLQSLDDVRELPVTVLPPGKSPLGMLPAVVRVADVADVRYLHVPPEGVARVNGRPSLLVSVFKESGQNTVRVSRAVKRAIAAHSWELAGLEVVPVVDQADFIVRSLASVTRNGAVGALLAVAVLYLFLFHGLTTLAVAIAIPLSLIATLGFMYLNGLNINLMSLGGLGLGVGMLVDNAIVVLESIFRHAERGEPPEQAARRGTAEVASAILASTLTTVVVFLPVVFVGGIAGRIFRELALTVSFALLASLLVSLTVVPMLAARLHLWEQVAVRTAVGAAARRRGAAWFDGVQRAYKHLLRRSLERRGRVFVLVAGLVALAAVLYPRVEVEFLAPVDTGEVGVRVQMPPGTPVETTDAIVGEIEQLVRQLPEVKTVAAQVGAAGTGDLLAALTGDSPYTGNLYLTLKPRGQRPSAAEFVESLRRRLAEVAARHPGARVRATDSPSFGPLSQLLGERVTLEVEGPDPAALARLASRLTERLEATPGFIDVTSSLEQREPALMLRVDPGRALTGGLTAAQVALGLREARLGQEAGELALPDGRRLPIVVLAEPERARVLQDVLALPVGGLTVPGLASMPPVVAGRVVRPEPAEQAAAIQHRDGRRVVTVTAELDGIRLGAAGRRVEAMLRAMEIPPGSRVELAGIHQLIAESFGDLWVALALAVLLVYMVMAGQFESLLDPLIVMLAVPLGLTGGLAALYATGNRIGVASIVGAVVLAGIAVNNGIVLIDYTNRLLRQGMELREAVVEAATVRLRPVLMTTLTTLLGLFPLTPGWGESGELEAPLAVTVVGGLALSAAVTLVAVPVARFSVGQAYRHLRRWAAGRHPVTVSLPGPWSALIPWVVVLALAASILMAMMVRTYAAAAPEPERPGPAGPPSAGAAVWLPGPKVLAGGAALPSWADTPGQAGAALVWVGAATSGRLSGRLPGPLQVDGALVFVGAGAAVEPGVTGVGVRAALSRRQLVGAVALAGAAGDLRGQWSQAAGLQGLVRFEGSLAAGSSLLGASAGFASSGFEPALAWPGVLDPAADVVHALGRRGVAGVQLVGSRRGAGGWWYRAGIAWDEVIASAGSSHPNGPPAVLDGPHLGYRVWAGVERQAFPALNLRLSAGARWRPWLKVQPIPQLGAGLSARPRASGLRLDLELAGEPPGLPPITGEASGEPAVRYVAVAASSSLEWQLAGGLAVRLTAATPPGLLSPNWALAVQWRPASPPRLVELVWSRAWADPGGRLGLAYHW